MHSSLQKSSSGVTLPEAHCLRVCCLLCPQVEHIHPYSLCLPAPDSTPDSPPKSTCDSHTPMSGIEVVSVWIGIRTHFDPFTRIADAAQRNQPESEYISNSEQQCVRVRVECHSVNVSTAGEHAWKASVLCATRGCEDRRGQHRDFCLK